MALKFVLYCCFSILGLVSAQHSAARERPMPQTFVDSMQRQSAYAYANDPDYWKQVEPDEDTWLNAINPAVVKYTVLISISLVLLWALYRLFSEHQLGLFGKRSRKIESGNFDVAPVYNLPVNELIEQAENQADFKNAVRYQYIKLLHALRDAGIMEYKPEWTPAEYVQAFGDHNRKKEFATITRLYEYVVFGGFETSSGQYAMIKQAFHQFNARL